MYGAQYQQLEMLENPGDEDPFAKLARLQAESEAEVSTAGRTPGASPGQLVSATTLRNLHATLGSGGDPPPSLLATKGSSSVYWDDHDALDGSDEDDVTPAPPSLQAAQRVSQLGLPPPPAGIGRAPSRISAPPAMVSVPYSIDEDGATPSIEAAQRVSKLGLPPPPAGIGCVPSRITAPPAIASIPSIDQIAATQHVSKLGLPPPPAGIDRAPSRITAPPVLPMVDADEPCGEAAQRVSKLGLPPPPAGINRAPSRITAPPSIPMVDEGVPAPSIEAGQRLSALGLPPPPDGMNCAPSHITAPPTIAAMPPPPPGVDRAPSHITAPPILGAPPLGLPPPPAGFGRAPSKILPPPSLPVENAEEVGQEGNGYAEEISDEIGEEGDGYATDDSAAAHDAWLRERMSQFSKGDDSSTSVVVNEAPEEEDPFEALARLQAAADADVNLKHRTSSAGRPGQLVSALTLRNLHAAPSADDEEDSDNDEALPDLNAIKGSRSEHWGDHDALDASDDDDAEPTARRARLIDLSELAPSAEPPLLSMLAPVLSMFTPPPPRTCDATLSSAPTRYVIGPGGKKVAVAPAASTVPPRASLAAPGQTRYVIGPSGKKIATRGASYKVGLSAAAVVPPQRLQPTATSVSGSKAGKRAQASHLVSLWPAESDQANPSPPSPVADTRLPSHRISRVGSEVHAVSDRTESNFPTELILAAAEAAGNALQEWTEGGEEEDDDDDDRPAISFPITSARDRTVLDAKPDDRPVFGLRSAAPTRRTDSSGDEDDEGDDLVDDEDSLKSGNSLKVVSVLTSARVPPASTLAKLREPIDLANNDGAKRGGGFFGAIVKAFGGGGNAEDGSPPSFDAPLDQYTTCSCYNCEVPSTVVHLWAALEGMSTGLDVEGIFRLTPDPGEVMRVEADIKTGRPLTTAPPEILAHLIKSFFRRLPPPGILGGVPIAKVVAAGVSGKRKDCASILDAMPQRERALLEWLVRVILEVNAKREVNKMTLRNQCVVWAPNLRLLDAATVAGPNGAEELKNVDHVANALHALCTHAFRQLRGIKTGRASLMQ